jgi:hypothetical protein
VVRGAAGGAAGAGGLANIAVLAALALAIGLLLFRFGNGADGGEGDL